MVRQALTLVESPAVGVAAKVAKVAAAASHARLRPNLSISPFRNYPRPPSTIAPSTEHVERPTAGCLLTLRSEKVRNRI